MAHNQQVNFDTNTSGTATTTLTVASGSNRLLVIGVTHRQGASNRYLATLTIGGQSATRKGYYYHGTTAYAFVEFWVLTESQVAAISANPSVTVTANASGNLEVAGTIFQLNDADQTAANFTEAVDGDTTQYPLESALSTATNSMICGVVGCTSAAASYTPIAGLTEVASSDRSAGTGTFRAESFYATASAGTTTIGGDINSSSGTTYQIFYAISVPVYNANATISGAGPTGTVGTQTQFTWSATTNIASGTAYLIANTDQSKVTGATGAQIAAGHGNDDLAATLTDSVAVSSTSISKTKTGASAGTTYYYAIVQVTGGSNYSDPLYGSFTTATATRALQSGFYLYSAANVPLASTAVVCWTKQTRSGAAVDGGTAGIAATTDSQGLLSLTSLTIPAGSYFLQVGLPDDDLTSDHVYPATFIAEA